MKPILKFLVGIPSSGKSTYAEKMKEEGYVIHASDALRIELYGNVNIFDKNGELFNELHKRIKADLIVGKNVVYDATGINRKKRMAFLQHIKSIDCVKDCVVLATPYNMCVQSDKKREKKVGSEVIKRMYFNFQFPMKQEGWDNIELIYHPDIDWTNPEYNMYAEMQNLIKINQNNEHHKLTIGHHCYKVWRLLKKELNKTNYDLVISGLIHDYGKKKCMSFENSRGEFGEFAHFYNHHNISTYDAMFYIEQELREDGIDSTIKDPLQVLAYISEHMQIHLLKEEKSIKKYIEFVGQDFWNDLVLFNKADTIAKE